jgi:hypothetical protein
MTRRIIGGLVIAAAMPVAAQKPSNTAEVRLEVTVSDRGSDGDYRIESDGFGAYVDGQNGVAARLDQYGNLIINFQSSRKGTRRVSFDYSCAYDGTPQCGTQPLDPPSGIHDGAYISTVCAGHPDLPCTRIQEMKAEDPPQCVQLNWQFLDAQGRQWRNGFQRTRDLPEQEGTAFAVVTRTGTDTWTVEPSAASCQGENPPGVARTFLVETVKSKWVYSHGEAYYLPFKLTLTRR